VGLVLILLAAVWSDGFHQSDEHFQTLEFAGWKLGRTPVSDLPWEFGARMRAWLQPALYVAVVRALEAAGMRDPFHQAFVLRLVSGLLAWAALVALTRAAWLLVPGDGPRRWSVRLTWLAFFTPYLAVRTSSESLATSCLVLGLVALVTSLGGRTRPPPGLLLAAGALFGLAFELRYAVGVMIAGALLWAVFPGGLRMRALAAIALAATAVLALGMLIDRWGYGEWTIPALNYVRINLGQGVAERFGTRPFYGYALLVAKSAVAPVLLPLALGAAVSWLRWPTHPLTAAAAPLVLAHGLIAHKELRFLFPTAPLLPTFLVLAVVRADGTWPSWLASRLPRMLGAVLLTLNVVGLVLLTLTATRPQIGFQRYAWRRNPESFKALILTAETPWHHGRLPMHFYRPRSLELRHVARLSGAEGPAPFFVVADAFDEPAAAGLACRALYRPYPPRLEALVRRLAPRLRAWSLHRCRGVKGATG
jgi:phosphatidylinositol glycan class B